MEEIAMTMEAAAEVESIYRTVYQGDGETDLQLDRLTGQENPTGKAFKSASSGADFKETGREGTAAYRIAVFSGYDSDRGGRKAGRVPGAGFPEWRSGY